jgi:hypothetical protein
MYATVYLNAAVTSPRYVTVKWTKKKIVWIGVVPVPIPVRGDAIKISGVKRAGYDNHPAYFKIDGRSRTFRMEWTGAKPFAPDIHVHCYVTVPKA